MLPYIIMDLPIFIIFMIFGVWLAGIIIDVLHYCIIITYLTSQIHANGTLPGQEINFQPAKIKTRHFGVSLKFFILNWFKIEGIVQEH